jgi:hypothetical protein
MVDFEYILLVCRIRRREGVGPKDLGATSGSYTRGWLSLGMVLLCVITGCNTWLGLSMYEVRNALDRQAGGITGASWDGIIWVLTGWSTWDIHRVKLTIFEGEFPLEIM